ncbi:hypothetical protein HZA39_00685 [Candidatus Peregrinibacteria bacterium]|nr:hypothetical protein [Candidatus Peregrinibacteria bacterium]
MSIIEIDQPPDQKTKSYVENIHQLEMAQTKIKQFSKENDPFEEKINNIIDRKMRNLIMAMYKARIEP